MPLPASTLRTPPRWALIFVGITSLVALTLFTLSATGYKGPWWVLFAAPALPFLMLAGALFPSMNNAASYIVTALFYGFVALLWCMPRTPWKVLLMVISVLYIGVMLLTAVSAGGMA